MGDIQYGEPIMFIINKMFILFLCLPIFFSACMNLKQPGNKIEYYTLEYGLPEMADLKPIPCVIRMERFTVAPVYNTNQIIYRDRSFNRNSYVYHKWRANPGDLVTHSLTRDIRQTGLFKAVLPSDSRHKALFVLEGTVDEFFEWDSEINWKAVLSVNITLITEDEPDTSKSILFQKSYHAAEECNRKDPSALVEAMSRSAAIISEEIIRDIHDRLKDLDWKEK